MSPAVTEKDGVVFAGKCAKAWSRDQPGAAGPGTIESRNSSLPAIGTLG